MDMRALTIFIEVAERKSFTKAGETLGYSQPTISFQIKQLEQELGVQLFDRIGHTVSLTDEGKDALAYAQKICRLSEEMIQGVSERDIPKGEVRLAMADSLCTPLIAGEFAAFRKACPKVSLKVMTAGTDGLFQMLDHNEADLVCTLDSHIYNTAYVIAGEEKIGAHFIVYASHPLAKNDSVDIREIVNEPFILTEKGMSYRRLLDEELAKRSIEIQPVLEMGNADLICRLVAEGVGMSFLPDYVTENAVRMGQIARLSVKDMKVEVWKQMLYRKDKWVTLPMLELMKFMQ